MTRWRATITGLFVRYRGVPAGAHVPLDALLDPGFMAIDVETTGLDPRRDALVAAAAIPFVRGVPQPGLVTLVNPGVGIPPASTAVHGITERDVADAPSVPEALQLVDAACAGWLLVGHDVAFDLEVFRTARARHAFPSVDAIALDTRRLTRVVDPHAGDSRLEAVAERLGISAEGRHTADGDARIAGEILVALLPALRARGARSVADLLRLQRATAPSD